MQPDATDLNEISTEDIAELAGVTSAAVSNWVKRERDFPNPLRIVGRRTLYSRTAVMAWLERNDKMPANADRRWQAELWRLADTARGAVRFTDLIEALAWTTAYLRDTDSVPANAAEVVKNAVSADSGIYQRLAAVDTMPLLFEQIRSTAARLAEHDGAPLEQLLDVAIDRDHTFDRRAGQLLLDDLIDAACIDNNDHVLDIDAGVGTLLRRISDRTGNTHLTGRFETSETMRVAEAVNAARGISIDTELADIQHRAPERRKIPPDHRPRGSAQEADPTCDEQLDPTRSPDGNSQYRRPSTSWEAIVQDALWNLTPRRNRRVRRQRPRPHARSRRPVPSTDGSSRSAHRRSSARTICSPEPRSD
jgi:predicted DNA-binding transcriptional regulator AlpA